MGRTAGRLLTLGPAAPRGFGPLPRNPPPLRPATLALGPWLLVASEGAGSAHCPAKLERAVLQLPGWDRASGRGWVKGWRGPGLGPGHLGRARGPQGWEVAKSTGCPRRVDETQASGGWVSWGHPPPWFARDCARFNPGGPSLPAPTRVAEHPLPGLCAHRSGASSPNGKWASPCSLSGDLTWLLAGSGSVRDSGTQAPWRPPVGTVQPGPGLVSKGGPSCPWRGGR